MFFVIACSNLFKFYSRKLNLLNQNKAKIINKIKLIEEENIKIKNIIKVSENKIADLNSKIVKSEKAMLKYAKNHAEIYASSYKNMNTNNNKQNPFNILKKKIQKNNTNNLELKVAFNLLNIEKEKISDYKDELDFYSKKMSLDLKIIYRKKIKENNLLKTDLEQKLKIICEEIEKEKIKIKKINLLNKEKNILVEKFSNAKHNLSLVILKVIDKIMFNANLSTPRYLLKFKNILLQEYNLHSKQYFIKCLKKLNLKYLNYYYKKLKCDKNSKLVIRAILKYYNNLKDKVDEEMLNWLKELEIQTFELNQKIIKTDSSIKNLDQNIIDCSLMIICWFIIIKKNMQIFLNLYENIQKIENEINNLKSSLS